jgi:hypothetical protein
MAGNPGASKLEYPTILLHPTTSIHKFSGFHIPLSTNCFRFDRSPIRVHVKTKRKERPTNRTRNGAWERGLHRKQKLQTLERRLVFRGAGASRSVFFVSFPSVFAVFSVGFGSSMPYLSQDEHTASLPSFPTLRIHSSPRNVFPALAFHSSHMHPAST